MGTEMKVLIVEDNDIDVLLATKLIEIADSSVEIVRFDNGKSAFEYLLSDAGSVDIIILDLNMPVMSGIGFLEARKEHASMMEIPVFVLSSSIDERDMINCQKLKTAAYIEKPMNLEKVRQILAFPELQKVG